VKPRSPAGTPPFLHLTPPAPPDYEQMSYQELLEEGRFTYRNLQQALHAELTVLDQPDWNNVENLSGQLTLLEQLFAEVGAEL
jgi:hypothetical protein